MPTILSFFGSAVSLTLVQLGGVLGMFFLIGTVLSVLQTKTHQAYHNLFGWYGILWTAWIGTPIHELSHVFFAKVFRHKVHKINLFKPDKKTGSLGHVDHSFDSNSLYQRIGNFFVGSAPLIGGSLALYALLYILVPDGDDVLALFPPVFSWPQSAEQIFLMTKALLTSLPITQWQTWLFLYVSFAIASHLAPSAADRKNMWEGLGYIAGTLLVINIIAVVLSKDITTLILHTTVYTQFLTAMFVWALCLAVIHWLIISVIHALFGR